MASDSHPYESEFEKFPARDELWSRMGYLDMCAANAAIEESDLRDQGDIAFAREAQAAREWYSDRADAIEGELTYGVDPEDLYD